MQTFIAEDVSAHVSELITWLLVKASEPFMAAMSEFIARGCVSEDTDPFVRSTFHFERSPLEFSHQLLCLS